MAAVGTEMALPNLLSSLSIGPVTVRNRIVSSSHQTTLVHEHLPTEEFVAYQAARAAGETGLIIMEAVAVAPSGLLTAHTLGGYLEITGRFYGMTKVPKTALTGWLNIGLTAMLVGLGRRRDDSY